MQAKKYVVLQVVVGLLISTSMDISKVKTCELENALNSLNLEYSPYPCKYKAITGESRDLKYFGFGALSSNFVLLILILCTMFCAYMCRKHNECISCFFYVTWILVSRNDFIASECKDKTMLGLDIYIFLILKDLAKHLNMFL